MSRSSRIIKTLFIAFITAWIVLSLPVECQLNSSPHPYIEEY